MKLPKLKENELKKIPESNNDLQQIKCLNNGEGVILGNYCVTDV